MDKCLYDYQRRDTQQSPRSSVSFELDNDGNLSPDTVQSGVEMVGLIIAVFILIVAVLS